MVHKNNSHNVLQPYSKSVVKCLKSGGLVLSFHKHIYVCTALVTAGTVTELM